MQSISYQTLGSDRVDRGVDAGCGPGMVAVLLLYNTMMPIKFLYVSQLQTFISETTNPFMKIKLNCTIKFG